MAYRARQNIGAGGRVGMSGWSQTWHVTEDWTGFLLFLLLLCSQLYLWGSKEGRTATGGRNSSVLPTPGDSMPAVLARRHWSGHQALGASCWTTADGGLPSSYRPEDLARSSHRTQKKKNPQTTSVGRDKKSLWLHRRRCLIFLRLQRLVESEAVEFFHWVACG